MLMESLGRSLVGLDMTLAPVVEVGRSVSLQTLRISSGMPQGLGGYALLKGRGCGMLGQGPEGNIHPCRMGKKLMPNPASGKEK